MSSQSRAGEWISTRRHVICIDSTEGLCCDLRRLREKKKGKKRKKYVAVIHEHLKPLWFVFMWFQAANPDQTVILKNIPGFHIWISALPTFYQWQTDNGVSGRCHLALCSPPLQTTGLSIPLSPSLSLCFPGLFKMYSQFHVSAPWQSCREVVFFFKERDAVSIYPPECIFKGAGPGSHYTCSCSDSWRGNPQWHLVEQPCQLFVCILNSSRQCVFPRFLGASLKKKMLLITTWGPSRDLHANTGKKIPRIHNHVNVIKDKEIH